MKAQTGFVDSYPGALMLSKPCGCRSVPRLRISASLSRRRALKSLTLGLACECCRNVLRDTALAAQDGSGIGFPGRKPFSNSWFAESMEYGMISYENEIAERKAGLFSGHVSQGDRILELGLGTGPNLKFFPSGVSVYGLEPNKAMHPYAESRKPKEIELEILTRSAESSGFEVTKLAIPSRFDPPGTDPHYGSALVSFQTKDAHFDVVVCTLLLCSVDDPFLVLKEAKRNLKAGGKLLFIEHVGAPRRTSLRLAQNVLNPLQRLFADNCHLNRDTQEFRANLATYYRKCCSMIKNTMKVLVDPADNRESTQPLLVYTADAK
ncbi:hypothetical protein NDN08_006556 [Rhodosorus marinus]|uniref:Methyltransferase type 11 domain-containing protein n=1 Tax=Rhodosorus marinus TaxID=101924 RepID=A0AAV8UI19_9RHOD|nr:hypothetical protein NDN08_006556 [Rhodosorus marinus]